MSDRERFFNKIRLETLRGEDIYRDGLIQSFGGYNLEVLSRKLLVLAELCPQSSAEVVERISYPLRDLAALHGFQLAIPGDGLFPPHITIQQIFVGAENDIISFPSNYASMITPGKIPFDSLVLSGAKLVICASDPSSYEARNVLSQRAQIGKVAEQFEGIPETDPDILHISVARIGALDRRKVDFSGFAKTAYNTVGAALSQEPCMVGFGRFFIGRGDNYARENSSLFRMSRRKVRL